VPVPGDGVGVVVGWGGAGLVVDGDGIGHMQVHSAGHEDCGGEVGAMGDP